MIAKWQYTLSWICGAAGLVCILIALWFAFLPNPSGDYLTGMGQFVLAVVAAVASIVFWSMAFIALVLHTRGGRIAAGIVGAIIAAILLIFML